MVSAHVSSCASHSNCSGTFWQQAKDSSSFSRLYHILGTIQPAFPGNVWHVQVTFIYALFDEDTLHQTIKDIRQQNVDDYLKAFHWMAAAFRRIYPQEDGEEDCYGTTLRLALLCLLWSPHTQRYQYGQGY